VRGRLLLAVSAVLAGALGAAVTARSAAADVVSDTSSNWAGYAVSGATFSSVSGSWVQPVATCSSGGAYAAFWVGLGGSDPSSQALEQVGTESDCTAGNARVYSVWYELLPAPPVTVKLKIRAGDRITASVTADPGTVTFTLRNVTRKTVFTKRLSVAAIDLSSAEWVAEAPSACDDAGNCRPLPLTNFGTATFTNASATADGHTGTISDPAWSATAISLVSGDYGRYGPWQETAPAGAVPGALSSDGSAFSVEFLRNS
jgi:peptidase A4-like protein